MTASGPGREAELNGNTNTNGIVDASQPNQKYTYLAGINVTHSIAPAMHNFIAASLGLPWTFSAVECPTVEDMMKLFRAPTFAGGVVTMPYKKAVMAHLDELDELATTLGACNNVYLNSEGKLCGTNTDWRGVEGCLRNATANANANAVVTPKKPALIIGAGGASRAAVYALFARLECNVIYIINRDDQEVADLAADAKAYTTKTDFKQELRLVHVKSVEQAQTLEPPYYVVGTVPDFPPTTPKEIEARRILEVFLQQPQQPKGVLLDMCFKPRNTSTLKLGAKYGWTTVDGTKIIGHQIQEQYRLWAGEDAVAKLDVAGAWEVLEKAASESKGINF
ncbi:shikimate dehydrogenase [Capronia epimyces CBS 606.96]|uniref:Shikimate dehydrogenase n=1 Tax=Capronia epimyces CBS 606.96 TaxID=1182542 RepID=W9Y2M9_9EURO|nr:shikimate dehydrogenase [Capronia epimyces CBS 606.96]EXJ86763.1 shikimate dehydrogenase [Capronia epimyces CBS 606.96]